MRPLYVVVACVVCGFLGRPACPQAYPLVCELDMNVDAYEPNPDVLRARFLWSDNRWIPRLSVYPAGDQDWFTWTSLLPGTLRVTVYENNKGPLLVVLADEAGNYLAYSNSMGDTEVLTYNVTSPSTYTIVVLSNNHGGTNLGYDLLIDGSAAGTWWNLSPTAPDVNLLVEETVPATVNLADYGARDINNDLLKNRRTRFTPRTRGRHVYDAAEINLPVGHQHPHAT